MRGREMRTERGAKSNLMGWVQKIWYCYGLEIEGEIHLLPLGCSVLAVGIRISRRKGLKAVERAAKRQKVRKTMDKTMCLTK